MICRQCPRECQTDRQGEHYGFCASPEEFLVARTGLHAWEEPPISGTRGSGTVFFSYCTLRCVYCQNHAISRGEAGKPVSIERLSEIFLELQQKGAYNLNLVTPTHYLPQILCALMRARNNGLTLPVVYNCGGYESVETLRLLDGFVDIYLPDFKYMSSFLSERYSSAQDYPQAAQAAIAEMVRQVGPPVFAPDGMLSRGVVVRHLALPHQIGDSKKVLRHLLDTFGDRIYISLMNQYTPVAGLEQFPELQRPLTKSEYRKLIDFACELGLTNGLIQEGGTASESFIPTFDQEGI